MKHYIRIYLHQMKNAMMRDLEYRADFAITVFQGAFFIFFNVLFYRAIYGSTASVGDWTYFQMVALFGVYAMIDAIFMTFIMLNFSDIEDQVRLGGFDMYLTKPMDSQFLFSSRRFNFKELPSFFLGLGIFLYGCLASGATWDLGIWVLSFLYFVCAVILFYCLSLIVTCTVFFIDKAEELHEIIFAVKQFSKFPDVYKGFVRYALMFTVPLVFTTFVPVGVIFGKVSISFQLYFVVITIFAMFLARIVWKLSIKNYKSSGS